MNKALIQEIKRKAVPILKQADVKKAALFGSYARGTEIKEESDIDIVVVYPANKSFFDFVETKLQLEDVLGKKVDLIEYETIKPRIKPYILEEQIPLI